jgi:hypothetical protein
MTKNYSRSISAYLFTIWMIQWKINIPLSGCSDSCRKNGSFQSQLHWSRRPPDNQYGASIRSRTKRGRHAAVQKIAHSFNIVPSIVWRRLAEELERKCFYLKWMPHSASLDADQFRATVELSKRLLVFLQSANRSDFHLIMTAVEFWFYCSYSPEMVWYSEKDKIDRRTDHKTDS